MTIGYLPKVDAIKSSNDKFTNSAGALNGVNMAYLVEFCFYYELQTSRSLIS
jgi:hypothetical protein